MNEMKPNGLIRAGMASMLTLGLITGAIYYNSVLNEKETAYVNELYSASEYKGEVINLSLETEEVKETEVEEVKEPERVVVYDDMTMEELTNKLDSVLSSDLSGKGYAFANYSIELGVDPYLAVAIAMHETGCTWNCSSLMRSCNNVGGQKGEGCGEYKAYDTLDEGIYGFILNIKNNYVDFGLTTAETMNPKYAEDPEWSAKVNKYIEKMKNS